MNPGTGQLSKERKIPKYILLLVGETTGGGFETLGGDKTQNFISRTEAYRSKNKHKSLIHALSLSL
jgi:hypothetical protein